MNRILKISIYISLLTTSIFCNSTVLPNDIRWVVSSEEYKQLCKQIYDHATYVCKIEIWVQKAMWLMPGDHEKTWDRPAIPGRTQS